MAYQPFPGAVHQRVTPPAPGPQRPAVIPVSVVMITTASMLWMAELALVWLFVQAGRQSFGFEGVEGALFHMLERFHLRMMNGLALALFGFPLVATVLSFFLLLQRSWPRIVISLLGLAAIVVTALLMPNSLRLLIPGAVYIAFTCVLLWVPGVTRWISRRAG